jgi:hypothetical protein
MNNFHAISTVALAIKDRVYELVALLRGTVAAIHLFEPVHGVMAFGRSEIGNSHNYEDIGRLHIQIQV